MKKFCCRMLETTFASISAGDISGEVGVGKLLVMPGAVAPMTTILPLKLSAGTLPRYTSA